MSRRKRKRSRKKAKPLAVDTRPSKRKKKRKRRRTPREDLPIHATRSAQLPPAPSDDPPDSVAPEAIAPEATPATSLPPSKPPPSEAIVPPAAISRPSLLTAEDRSSRISLIDRVSRLSVNVAGRTSLTELASIAGNITVETKSHLPPRFGLRVILTISLAALVTLIVTASIAVGSWRWVPIAFLFMSIVALVSWGALTALPRLARTFGDREIPGRAAMWLTFGFGVIAGVSGGITWTVSSAAQKLGRAAWPALAPEEAVALRAPAAVAKAVPIKPEKARKARKTWVDQGVLFMPKAFEVRDGGFDLVLFFHGNPDIVKEAVPRAGLNALVHVTNLGVGSEPYQTRYLVPDSMLALIDAVERHTTKLGLPKGLKARRVALASWSAGYGAIHSLLLDPDHVDRTDAILILDGIHGGFRPNTKRDVDPTTIAPFLKFAKRAVAGEKLMMITHSRVRTLKYTSTTQAADAMLEALDINREKVDLSRSPPEVKFKAAVNAFPWDKRRWLQARTEGHAGNFHVFGYDGHTEEDHIAHLAQMSVTVLPPLVERWKNQPSD